MGLDVSHDTFTGAYSAFHRFRIAVARATGGDIHQTDSWPMEAYFELGPGHDNESHPALFEFLGHSDCGGEIDPVTAGKLADEMEVLLPALDAMGDGGGHLARAGGYGAVARRWIAGCRRAAQAGEPLEFY